MYHNYMRNVRAGIVIRDICERNRMKYLVEYEIREKNQGRLAPKYLLSNR